MRWWCMRPATKRIAAADRTALRPGEVLDPAADRCEQFEQRGVFQRHLRLDAPDPQVDEVVSQRGDRPQEQGLADAGLTLDDKGRRVPGARMAAALHELRTRDVSRDEVLAMAEQLAGTTHAVRGR